MFDNAESINDDKFYLHFPNKNTENSSISSGYNNSADGDSDVHFRRKKPIPIINSSPEESDEESVRDKDEIVTLFLHWQDVT